MSLNLDFNSTEYQGKEEIDLKFKRLTSLPESIGNLKSLKRLNLESNRFTSLPESIGNLKSLKKLNLEDNGLTSLPESIGNLEDLEELNLKENNLTSLPESIGNLKSLEELILVDNKLTSLPESIGNLKELKQIILNDNRLTSLPESIGNLIQLKKLYLSSNRLTSLPESIGNLKSLEALNLSSNQLTSLPDSIRNITGQELTITIYNSNINFRVPENLPNNIRIIGLEPQPQQVDAHEIHKSTAKINFDHLISFFKSKTGNLNIPIDLNFPNFIKQVLVTCINHSKEPEEVKNKKKEELEIIMRERVSGYNYSNLSPQMKEAVFYILIYIDSQTQDFKNIYIDTFLTDCIQSAYLGRQISCILGVLERTITSLITACSGVENQECKTIIEIVRGPQVSVNDHITDWYKLHKTGTKDGFTEVDTPEIRRANLKEYLKMKLPGQSDEWIEAKIKEIADHIGWEDDDFMYGGRRRRRRKTKKLRKITKTKKQRKTKKLRKQKKTKKRKPKVKKAPGRTKKN